MFDALFNHSKKIFVSLRFSILTIFISLFVTSLLAIIGLNYIFSSRNLLFTATRLMYCSSSCLYKEFKDELQTAERDNSLSAQILEHNIIDPNNLQGIVDYTYDLANRFYLVQASYWMDDRGNFVITKYENDDSLTTIIHHENQAKETIFRDPKGNIIRRETSPVLYDPRVRPWYLAAKNTRKTIWTDIYLFAPTPYLGITVATPVYIRNQFIGVFGLDVRLDWLSWYVGEQKISPNGLVFIVSDDGKLIAFPGLDKLSDQTKLLNINEINKPWIAESYNIYKKTRQSEFNFYYKNKHYLAVYKSIPNVANHTWLIGIVVPSNDFVSSLKKTSLLNILAGLAILLLGILIVSALVTKIVRPIKKLVKQTEKIKNFELDGIERVKSRIQEVMLLSDAIFSMKSGLKSFQQYVPASLVRQLIENEEDARIGGSKRELVVLFSDVKNFTSIAENMNPDQLMEEMCEYFDVLSSVIISEKGTIDKYIGDSIMAFWGAPVIVEKPCDHAADAALKCLKKMEKLNSLWVSEGKNKLTTRIGIHLGDAIVGNIGSSERMNYTAIGDTINFASRLEGLNKIYKTNILVSEDVYQIIKNRFVLRMVDFVAVKGKHRTITIYELLAKNINELSFDLENYNRTFAQAFAAYQNQEWDSAITLFKQCVLIYTDDYLAPHFIARCEKLKKKPPKDWDGVWRYSKK